MTTEFYARVSDSFSATRQSPWAGWSRLLELVEPAHGRPLSVFDVACGNLRFERFLGERMGDLEVWAVDNCDELVGECDATLHYRHVDLCEALLATGSEAWPSVPPCDLAVSFGFMHHLPLFEQRARLLDELVGHTRPGGLACVTFWQFHADPRLRAKACPAPGGGEHDFLLGWQDERDVRRFCHHATEEEIDALVATLGSGAHEVARFSADGRSGELNRYVVLRPGP